MLTALLAPRKSRTAKPLVEEIGMFIAVGTTKKEKWNIWNVVYFQGKRNIANRRLEKMLQVTRKGGCVKIAHLATYNLKK